MKLSEWFQCVQKKRIIVIGDVMLDEHVFCDVDGFSPESEIAPKLRVRHREWRPGGAANVALNLRAMGAHPILIGVVGPDEHGKQLLALPHTHSLEAKLYADNRPTTHKLRYLTLRGQQVIRIDSESSDFISPRTFAHVRAALLALRGGYEAVIISDYSKGMISPSMLDLIHGACPVPIFVDPKGTDFKKYGKVEFITPNEKEAYLAAGAHPSQSLREVAANIERQSHFLFIKRSGSPAMLFDGNAFASNVYVHERTMGDPTGCGDSTIAALAIAYVSDLPVVESCRVACAAGSVAFDRVGVYAVTRDDIVAELEASERFPS